MTVPCDEIQRLIPWLLDDELDAAQSLEVEAHLGTCSECRALFKREGQLRLVLRRAAASIAVPTSLRNRIHDLMERERRAQTGWSKAWPAVVAMAILLSFVWKGTSGGFTADLEELAIRHGRDLPMDVVAPDTAAVQTYLSGKLPFRVQIPELGPLQPLRLEGGRIIHLGDHDAAYVRYDTPHGRLSLVMYEDMTASQTSDVAPVYGFDDHQLTTRRVHGYSAAQWKSSGLVYSMVSDLPESEFSWVLQQSIKTTQPPHKP